MTFSQKLAYLREQKALTQQALAERLNKVKGGEQITRDQIGQWEIGKNWPEVDKLIILSNFFNISLDDLLKDKNKIK